MKVRVVDVYGNSKEYENVSRVDKSGGFLEVYAPNKLVCLQLARVDYYETAEAN